MAAGIRLAIDSRHGGRRSTSVLIAGQLGWSIRRKNVMFLAKMRFDGSLEASFGERGVAIADATTGVDGAMAITLCLDGSIVLAGFALNGRGSDGVVVKYRPDGGGLCDDFGRNGRVVTMMSPSLTPYLACAETIDASIIAGGFEDDLRRRVALITGLGGRGRPLRGFAEQGHFLSSRAAAPSAVCTMQSDGMRILFGGYSSDRPVAGIFSVAGCRSDLRRTCIVESELGQVTDISLSPTALVFNIYDLRDHARLQCKIIPGPGVNANASERQALASRPTAPRLADASRQFPSVHPDTESRLDKGAEQRSHADRLYRQTANTHAINMQSMSFAMSLPRGHSW